MSAIPDFSDVSQTSRDFREEGQQATYAVQQKPPLFDHLVAECDHPAALESHSPGWTIRKTSSTDLVTQRSHMRHRVSQSADMKR
jgi:hypothetical protein